MFYMFYMFYISLQTRITIDQRKIAVAFARAVSSRISLGTRLICSICSICSIRSLWSKCSSETFRIKDVRNHLKAPKSDKKVNLRRLQLACEHKPKICLRNLLKSSLSFYGARLKLRKCETSFTSEIFSCLNSLFTMFKNEVSGIFLF